MLGLASSGIPEYDYFINQFNISELTVPDLSLHKHLLFERNKISTYKHKTLVEVGLPFKDYPIFENLEIPWIVATPTLFSFTSEFEKNIFLQDILNFINQNIKNETIYYKPHNATENDYFKTKKFTHLIILFVKIPFVLKFFKILSKLFSYKHNIFYKIYNLVLHNQLILKTKPFDIFHECSFLALESYMNCIKYGIIGGDSNLIWGARYFNIPYINCVNSKRRLCKSLLLKKTGNKYLELNLKYFGIPYFKDNVSQQPVDYQIVIESTNLCNYIKSKL